MVSRTEALALTIPAGHAFAGVLAVFAACGRDVSRERMQDGMCDARTWEGAWETRGYSP